MRATTIVVIAMFAVEISAIVVEVCDNKRRIVNFIVIVNAIALQHLNGDQRVKRTSTTSSTSTISTAGTTGIARKSISCTSSISITSKVNMVLEALMRACFVFCR